MGASQQSCSSGLEDFESWSTPHSTVASLASFTSYIGLGVVLGCVGSPSVGTVALGLPTNDDEVRNLVCKVIDEMAMLGLSTDLFYALD